MRIGYGRSFDIGVFGSNFGHAVTQNLPVLVHQNISAHDVNPLGINKLDRPQDSSNQTTDRNDRYVRLLVSTQAMAYIQLGYNF